MWHSELRVLAQAVPSLSGRSPASAPFLSAKLPPRLTREAVRHLPAVRFELRGFIVLNVLPTRHRGLPGIPGRKTNVNRPVCEPEQNIL